MKTIMKWLLPVGAFLAGVMFSDSVKPTLKGIPLIGGLFGKPVDSTDTTTNPK